MVTLNRENIAKDDSKKVKILGDFLCLKCGQLMINISKGNKSLIYCIKDDCPNKNKFYGLPEIEVKEYENSDSKK